MEYFGVKRGVFLRRCNRFAGEALIDGELVPFHLKNTGRLTELLVEGREAIFVEVSNPSRKTRYDLVSIYYEGKLVNLDSMAPNVVAEDFIRQTIKNIKLIKREHKYLDSRLDYYVETNEAKFYIEIKGVNYNNQGVAMFPVAPTQRGIKHLDALIHAVKQGNRAMVIFIVQYEGAVRFEPHKKAHLAFSQKLKEAKNMGVEIFALDCKVKENEVKLNKNLPVFL
jgi:sugar fermentation stimulation protein A